MSKSYRPDEVKVVLTLPDGTEHAVDGFSEDVFIEKRPTHDPMTGRLFFCGAAEFEKRHPDKTYNTLVEGEWKTKPCKGLDCD